MSEENQHIKQPKGFKIHENYFEEFRRDLSLNLESKPHKMNLYKWLYLVASICVLTVSIFIFQSPKSNQSTNLADTNISDIEYFDIEIDDIYLAYSEIEQESNINTDLEEAKALYLYEDIDLQEFALFNE